MATRSSWLSLVFSCLGHSYMHMFAAFYFVIVLALEADWNLPYHELVELWTLGSLLVGLAALPAGWIADRWSASAMMVVFFVGLGASSILCGLVDGKLALFLGLTSLGLFAAIYHPVGIAWLVRNAESRGKALGVNGIFGALGIAVSGAVAGGLIDAFGWRAAFLVPGAVCLVTGLALWVLVARGEVVDGVAALRRDAPPSRGDRMKVYAVLVFTMLVMGLIAQGTQASLPKLFDIRLRDIAGEGAFGIGMIVAGVYTVGGLMQLVGGHLADRYPLKPVYLGTWVLLFPVLFSVSLLAGLPLIVAATLTVLLSTVALPAENMMLARYTPERHQSLAFGAKFVLSFGTAPLAIYAAAQIQERTGEFAWLYILLGGLAASAALAAVLLPASGNRLPEPASAPAPAE